MWICIGFFVVGILLTLIVYIKYIASLPSIKDLEKIEIAEASTIFDREGNELYKIFEEKRTYRDYGDISQNMVHAIVA